MIVAGTSPLIWIDLSKDEAGMTLLRALQILAVCGVTKIEINR